jgi:hypothetical protein
VAIHVRSAAAKASAFWCRKTKASCRRVEWIDPCDESLARTRWRWHRVWQQRLPFAHGLCASHEKDQARRIAANIAKLARLLRDSTRAHRQSAHRPNQLTADVTAAGKTFINTLSVVEICIRKAVRMNTGFTSGFIGVGPFTTKKASSDVPSRAPISSGVSAICIARQ